MSKRGRSRTQRLGSESSRILVTGVARSGTTWVGRVLGEASDTIYVNEPDNRQVSWFADVGKLGLTFLPVLDVGDSAPQFEILWSVAFRGGWPEGVTARTVRNAALRMPEGMRLAALSAFGRGVARVPATARAVVCKSVYIALCLEWVVSRTGARPLVVRRDPRNVLASWLELGVPPYPLDDDPRVRLRLLDPLGIPRLADDASPVQRVAWTIGVLDLTIREALKRHPEWEAVSHEELCRDPSTGFRRLFDELGLGWTEQVERFLSTSNRPGAAYATERIVSEVPDSWKRRLSDRDLEQAEEVFSCLGLEVNGPAS